MLKFKIGLIWIICSTLGFIAPWLFLAHASMLEGLLTLNWAQVVCYGVWFLLASSTGRLVRNFLPAGKIKVYLAIAAGSLIVSGLIVAVWPSPIGILAALLITAVFNGSIFFAPVIEASIQHFPRHPSLAVAVATVGQLTAASVSNYFSIVAKEISPLDPISSVLLVGGILLLLVSRFVMVPIRYPVVDIDRDAGSLIGVAFAFCGFCVTAAGTSFIFAMPSLTGDPERLAYALTAFSLSALVGRIGSAYLQDGVGYPMHVVSATAVATGCILAFFLLGGASQSWVLLSVLLFGIGYGGITPTYLAKLRSLFSGASARKQNLNFFVFASGGILVGSVLKLVLPVSVMSAFSMALAVLNLVLIVWIFKVRTSVYSRANQKDFEE